MHNLAIIGGGPGGYVAAERAGAKGLSVVLFDKKELGGVCLNEGCMPAKTLLYSAKIYDAARHAGKYGISAPGVTFDFAKIVDRKNKVIRKLVAGVNAKMRACKVEVVKGHATITGCGPDGIDIECAGKHYKAASLLVCTGSEAIIPPIPGLASALPSRSTGCQPVGLGSSTGCQPVGLGSNTGCQPVGLGSNTGCQPVDGSAANVARASSPCDGAAAGSSGTGDSPVDGAAAPAPTPTVLTNREILALKEQPKSLVIIGGGVIGMEFASFYNSLGTEVTVIEMLPEILGGFDAEISALLRDAYAKKGVKFHLSCKVTKVDGNKVTYTDSSGAEQAVAGDKILVSVGRRPVTMGFGLEKLGVVVERGGIKVDDRMRTNVPGVYAAGDVTGFSMLAHTASREGEVVVNNLTGGSDVMRYDAIPGVVYTNPEVACVGLTSEAAKTRGIACRELKLPMAYAGRFIAENEGGAGLCKVVVGEKHGQVLGVHMIGNPASEMIYGACMAIESEMTVKELQEVIFPHPTVSEIIKEAAFTF